ncbi:MAG: DNA-binding protein HU-beta [Gaiellaceae bacterium]|nr:DNA-binding protein HU-beta [Gaiellaceae bacterium]
MTKQEFVDKVAQKGNLSRRDAAEAVDAVLESITEVLRGGGEVNFTGFGKFSTQFRKERQGVNPRNPTEKVTIPAATVPKFSAGSSLKTAVKTGGAGAGGGNGGGGMGGGGGF